MNARRSSWTPALLGLTLAALTFQPVRGQDSTDHVALLEQEHPEVYDMLVRIDRVQGLFFARLAEEGETVRASEDKLPGFDFEFDMLDELNALLREPGTLDHIAEEAERGYSALGERAAAIVKRAQRFRLETLGILADPGIADYAARRAALSEAVARYRQNAQVALTAEPKDMDILYDHPHALDFRTGYADLGGLLWAGHWYVLAATEPLVDLAGQERLAGFDTIQTRYYAKLSYGEPPEYFPSELPMAPAIAVGFRYMSPEAAVIWDNLSMFQEVLADILASPDATDVRADIEGAVDFFLDPTVGMTDELEWAAMALRHGIFFQGGHPISVMLESERNADGHAAHILGGGGLARMTFPGM